MGSYEYWLISAPGDKTCQQTFEKLNQVIILAIHAVNSFNAQYLGDFKAATLCKLEVSCP